MSRGDASLSRLLWYQEEVEALIVGFILHKTCVNDATWRRVLNLVTMTSLDEHSLVDPLVHHNERDLWKVCRFVVHRLNGFFELRDLLVNDLVSHLLANSIPVDDDLCWKLPLIFAELSQRIGQALVEILFHELLILSLNDDVREKGSAMLIGRSNETND